MKTTLLIMAAGIGSRFGGGIKQLEAVGMHGEIIMDYSIHDAIEAGFNKIVFIIRRDIEEDFRKRIGDRIEKICREHGVETAYAFQNREAIPKGFSVPAGRTKPWGTGQAVLAAKDILRGPFTVINADDYYGKTAYRLLHDWLVTGHTDKEIGMAGFILKNTLSDNGGVTRGVCTMVPDGRFVQSIVETKSIYKTMDGAEADGKSLLPDTFVSMNMWGFPAKEGAVPAFMTILEQGFESFFRDAVPDDPLKAEYLLPTLIGTLLKNGTHTVEVMETRDSWFGVTYKEDKAAVVSGIRQLIESGVYSENLYSDL